MQVQSMMTAHPACCTPDASLQQVAQMMVDNDCGCIPVIDSETSKRIVGVITDRDITVRAVAQGRNPLDLTAGDCMTTDVVTVMPQTSIEDCLNLMESRQVRRIPVVDERGACCGMVAQADVALEAGTNRTAEMVREVSQPGNNAVASDSSM